jgi:ankyrin repeat protein
VNNHLAVLQLLLLQGADINAVSTKGFTAVVWAARFGRVEAAKALINAGYDARV